MAVDEINRVAPDKRFVQVLMLVMGDMPLGKRHYWPIYAAAEKHGLPIGIHAGSAYRHPVTSLGWPTYYTEDYAAQAPAFQQCLSSLICEGVFTKYPRLKSRAAGVRVYLAAGASLAADEILARPADRGAMAGSRALRNREIERSADTQPCDAPPTEEMFQKLMEHMDSDELLLFSTDYPHWQFDGDDVLPPGLPREMVRKIMIDNPRATYSRLAGLNPRSHAWRKCLKKKWYSDRVIAYCSPRRTSAAVGHASRLRQSRTDRRVARAARNGGRNGELRDLRGHRHEYGGSNDERPDPGGVALARRSSLQLGAAMPRL